MTKTVTQTAERGRGERAGRPLKIGAVCGLIEGTRIEHAPAAQRGIAARRKVKR